MSKFLRIALAWLLAVALPVQGYAAQAMLLCGPAHHQSAAVHDHASHDHAGASENLTDSGLPHGDATGPLNSSLDHHAKTVKSGHGGKCSACTSSCSTAAITTAVLAIEIIPQHLPVVSMIPTGNAVDTVGGLDRPPRSFIA